MMEASTTSDDVRRIRWRELKSDQTFSVVRNETLEVLPRISCNFWPIVSNGRIVEMLSNSDTYLCIGWTESRDLGPILELGTVASSMVALGNRSVDYCFGFLSSKLLALRLTCR